ncbi:MAG: phosphoadenosine phosphosulfate reductase domain-containing protein [Candidatus Heimdallarchaeaceae archaeon]
MSNSNKPYRVVYFSGGKDSTAMLIVLLENQIPFDEIIFNDTEVEFPEIYTHINLVQKKLEVKITYLKPKKHFEYWMCEHRTRKGNIGYGWPRIKLRWCTKLFKQRAESSYFKKKQLKNIRKLIGISTSEINRMKKYYKQEIYPLVKFGIDSQEALKICYRYGFDWNGLYEKLSHTGCFWCPFRRLRELENIYRFYPHLWVKMMELDGKCWNKFRENWTLKELEKRFKNTVYLF